MPFSLRICYTGGKTSKIERIRAMRRLLPLFLALLLCGCAADDSAPLTPPAPPPEEAQQEPSASPEEAEPAPQAVYEILDPTLAPEGGEREGVPYVPYEGTVEHLFFHPLVAYPEQAFDGDAQSDGIDDYMVTVDEYKAILESLYARDFILVDIGDVWSESTNETGEPRMVKNTLYLPEGKKPLIISFDDVCYYPYMQGNGFPYKLILDEEGHICSWGLDPTGEEVVSHDLDAIPILDRFVEEHPDFSPFGAKAALGLTGYAGILGYRTGTDTKSWTPEQEAHRQKEREAVKPIIKELKRTGWTFASHSWGHIRLGGSRSLESIQRDTERWLHEVGSLVGPTKIFIYPHGERPDGDDWHKTGPIFRYLQSQGFRVFASVGINSFSHIKNDISAVICDRLHPDGTTLRGSKKVVEWYRPFYDTEEIIDLEHRPQRYVRWMESDS